MERTKYTKSEWLFTNEKGYKMSTDVVIRHVKSIISHIGLNTQPFGAHS